MSIADLFSVVQAGYLRRSHVFKVKAEGTCRRRGGGRGPGMSQRLLVVVIILN